VGEIKDVVTILQAFSSVQKLDGYNAARKYLSSSTKAPVFF
jgi:hypothetical protein